MKEWNAQVVHAKIRLCKFIFNNVALYAFILIRTVCLYTRRRVSPFLLLRTFGMYFNR